MLKFQCTLSVLNARVFMHLHGSAFFVTTLLHSVQSCTDECEFIPLVLFHTDCVHGASYKRCSLNSFLMYSSGENTQADMRMLMIYICLFAYLTDQLADKITSSILGYVSCNSNYRCKILWFLLILTQTTWRFICRQTKTNCLICPFTSCHVCVMFQIVSYIYTSPTDYTWKPP